MAFGIKKNITSNQRGFASFEFAWAAFFMTIMLITFFRFFNIFNVTTRALITARHRAFEKVGQPMSGWGNYRLGKIRQSEIAMSCPDGLCQFWAEAPNPFLTVGKQSVYLVLNP